MRLELSHIRQPETDFHKVYQPADIASGGEDYRVTAPVDLRGLAAGKVAVAIRYRLKSGAVKLEKRRYQTCAKRR